MRGQHDIRQINQGLGDPGLVSEDVERGPSYGASLQRRDEGVFIDHRSPSDIDEVSLWTERLKHLAVNHAVGVRPCGHGHDQNIRLLRQGA